MNRAVREKLQKEGKLKNYGKAAAPAKPAVLEEVKPEGEGEGEKKAEGKGKKGEK